MSKKTPGPLLFEHYYQNIYQERWPTLKAALMLKGKRLALNVHGQHPPLSIPGPFPQSYWPTEEERAKIDLEMGNQIWSYYLMGPASIWAARALNPLPSDHVLDMCAAPGGKSLVLLQMLNQDGRITCNEMSMNRKEKLRRVLSSYLCDDIFKKIKITGHDGALIGLKVPQMFDAILVDAPCSSEEHLLQNPKFLDDWSEKRTKKLAQTQYALLCSALLASKPGAQILYSTCSISPLENDGVIEKLIAKKGDSFKLAKLESPFPEHEKTKYGIVHLPDRGQIGPLYCAKLIKN